MREEYIKDNDMMDCLRMVSPGTPMREGLENILRARTGALIVIGDSPEVMKIVDQGFFINKEYSPSHIYELAKMDGAIILSKDTKKILCCNSLLIPDPSIPTGETGTRHINADRFAKQTGEVVICISQRRNIITLYKGYKKYILRDSSVILAKANQALETLERYKMVLDNALANLNALEFENAVTIEDMALVIQRTEMVMRIAAEIDRYICELGNEGRLLSMQLNEVLDNTESDGRLVIEDYRNIYENRPIEEILRQIRQLNYDELADISRVYRIMGYHSTSPNETIIEARGYRVMNKVPKVPMGIARKVADAFSSLQSILKASIEDLDEVEGIGSVRARVIKDGLRRLQEQVRISSFKS